MVIVGSQLGKSLVQHRHHPEVGKEVIERFTLNYRQYLVSVHKRIVAGSNGTTLSNRARETPRVFLVAVYANNQLRASLA